MKTVMKKMFCLLLVAVMLVSAVPAAFADVADTVACPESAHTGCVGEYVNTTVEPTCTTDGTAMYHCNAPVGLPAHDFPVTIPKLGHSWTAEVKKAATCSETGLKVHTCVRGCTENETLAIDPNNHSFSGGICTGCGICENCKQATCVCCPDCGSATGHAATCPTLLCPKGCGQAAHGDSKCCTVCNLFGHHQTACPNLFETCCNVAKGSEHRTGCSFYCNKGRNCPNASIQNAAHKDGCEYNLCSDTQCTFEKSHSGNHSYECQLTQGCTRANGHSGACNPPADPNAVCSKCNGGHETADCPNDGDYDLKIYATMWTGDGREETVYLGTFYNLSTNTKIAEYMDENSTRIHNWVAAKCSGYGWNDGKIYEDKKSYDKIEWNDRMGYSDQEAYINVSRPSKDVVLFLHTARVYDDYDWIKVEGMTTDDTLSLDEAKAIVKKYYSFSSLKMYSNDNWNEYVDGNNNIAPQKEVEIGSGNVTKIHILMSGYSAKSSSGNRYTADSSNPKTGDDIFAPAMIMGLSASALAVVYFLNKKRAF